MAKAFPAEFRRDVVAVARKRETPLNQIAKDFGISEATLHNWLKRADIEEGVRPGFTEAEEAELRELKKRNRLLEHENYIDGLLLIWGRKPSQNDVPAGHRSRRRGNPRRADLSGARLPSRPTSNGGPNPCAVGTCPTPT
jgi:transposase